MRNCMVEKEIRKWPDRVGPCQPRWCHWILFWRDENPLEGLKQNRNVTSLYFKTWVCISCGEETKNARMQQGNQDRGQWLGPEKELCFKVDRCRLPCKGVNRICWCLQLRENSQNWVNRLLFTEICLLRWKGKDSRECMESCTQLCFSLFLTPLAHTNRDVWSWRDWDWPTNLEVICRWFWSCELGWNHLGSEDSCKGVQ